MKGELTQGEEEDPGRRRRGIATTEGNTGDRLKGKS